MSFRLAFVVALLVSLAGDLSHASYLQQRAAFLVREHNFPYGPNVQSLGEEHECIHDQLPVFEPVVAEQNYAVPGKETTPRGVRRQTDFLPIRLTFDIAVVNDISADSLACQNEGDVVAVGGGTPSVQCSDPGLVNDCLLTCTADDILTAQKRDHLVNIILPEAKRFLENALGVERIPGNLIIANDTSCPYEDGSTTLPPSYLTTGIPDTDLVLLVSARPKLGSTIAYAQFCQVDGKGRPVVGHVNFNPNRVQIEAEQLPKQIAVAIHEITHVLGFAAGKFNDFRDPGNINVRLPRILEKEEVTWGNRPRNLTRIVTQKVTQWLSRHFDCQIIAGGEIEDGGGPGTRGSHWEKRVFSNEFMTGTASSNPMLSGLTFALLADSAWYSSLLVDREFKDASGVEVSAHEEFAYDSVLWGKGGGCGFASSSCTLWGTRNGGCSTAEKPACTHDHIAKGKCNLVEQNSETIPAEYQYYTSTSKGGSSDISDYCPFVSGFSNGDCRFGPALAPNVHEEEFDVSGRCFDTGIYRAQLPSPAGQGCYRTACPRVGRAKVKIGPVWYNCDQTGAVVSPLAPDEAAQVAGESVGLLLGSLTCPNPAILCANRALDPDWPEITSITPTEGPAGTTVTITGRGFKDGVTVAFGGVLLADMERDAAGTTITGKIGSYVDVNVINTAKNLASFLSVVVSNRDGRTDVKYQVFDLEVGVLGELTGQLAAALGDYFPPVAAALGFYFLLAIGTSIWLCYRRARHGARQKKRAARAKQAAAALQRHKFNSKK